MKKNPPIFVLLMLCIYMFLSCVPIQRVPTTPAEYREVGAAPFASGAYVNELQYKHVKIRAFFGHHSDVVPGGYTRGRVVTFEAFGPQAGQSFTVVASRDLAGPVFSLNTGTPITLYGRAIPVYRKTVIGRVDEILILEAHRIEGR